VARSIGKEFPIVYDTEHPEEMEFGSLSGKLGIPLALVTSGVLLLVGAVLSLVGVAKEK
jgi:hypothetical protein